jgi:hypothetical protein
VAGVTVGVDDAAGVGVGVDDADGTADGAHDPITDPVSRKTTTVLTTRSPVCAQ